MLLDGYIPPHLVNVDEIPAGVDFIELGDGDLVARRVVFDHGRTAETRFEVFGACSAGGWVVCCLEYGASEALERLEQAGRDVCHGGRRRREDTSIS